MNKRRAKTSPAGKNIPNALLRPSPVWNERGQGVIGLIVFLLVILLISWSLGKEVTTTGPRVIAITAGIVVALATFVNPDAGFIVLIFSMLLSPELKVGGVPQRAVIMRIDDVLLFLVFITWWGRLALRRELGILRKTPLNMPLIFFILVCVFSTMLGVIDHTIASPKSSFFYILKYTEYFMVYFMFASQIRSAEQLRHYIAALIITYLIVIGFSYVGMGQGFTRLTAPFEGEHGEPNTLAGYLVLMLSVILGIALYAPSRWLRAGLIAMCCLGLPVFFGTLSRGGLVGMLVAYLTLIYFAQPRQRPLLIICLLVFAAAFPIIMPTHVMTRLTSTFTTTFGHVQVGKRYYLDPSAAQRVEVWPWVLSKCKERPWFGYGVTGLGLVDQQYALILGEVGLVGMALYLRIRWLLWKQGLRILRAMKEPLYQGLTCGFLAGFAGLLVHSFAGNIFIIVRIMEPFWALAAMVMVLPALTPSLSRP